MANLKDRLALIITANAEQAIRAIRGVGRTAEVDLGKASSKTDKLRGALGRIPGGAVGAAAAFSGLAAAAVQSASALGEQVAATKQLFGGASKAVLDFGKKAADSFGISNVAALKAANSFGNLFINVGVAAQQAVKFSTQLVRLAADIASNKDLNPEDVLQGLQSGLVGETEPLRKFGIIINEATVKAKAMALGIAGANGEVSEGAKVQVRYALILEKSTNAQGDFARTADSLANKQRRLNAQWEDFKAKIGEAFIPAASNTTGALSDLAEGVSTVDKAISGVLGFGPDIHKEYAFLADGAKKAAEAYEQLTAAEAKKAKSDDMVRKNLEAVKKAMEGVTKATDDQTEAFISQIDSGFAYERSLNNLEDAQKAYSEALHGEPSKEADRKGDAAAAKALTEAQIKLNEEVAKYGSASLQAKAAREGLAAAQERASTKEKRKGPGTREEQERALLALREAYVDVAQAAVRQADDQAKAAGKVLAEADKYRIYRDKLIALKDTTAPGSELRQNLEGLINALPADRTATITVMVDTTRVDALLAKLREARALMGNDSGNILAGVGSGGGSGGGSVVVNINGSGRADAELAQTTARELGWRRRGWR